MCFGHDSRPLIVEEVYDSGAPLGIVLYVLSAYCHTGVCILIVVIYMYRPSRHGVCDASTTQDAFFEIIVFIAYAL